jgi:UDP-N-acetylmuramoyl-L-alanyl-D-glutamate--2,6-diaminopimelate ligase
LTGSPNFGQSRRPKNNYGGQQLKLIGVTGANGKTTTSCLIAGILTAAGHRVGMWGSLGFLDGRAVVPIAKPKLTADRLTSVLARMAQNDCAYAVVEVSRRALDRLSIADVRFDAVCVTNIVRNSVNYRLADEGFAVFNADDPGSAKQISTLDGPVLTVGINKPAEIMAVPVEQHMSEQTFLLSAGSETAAVRTQMIGVHHIYNCLTAAGVGLTLGIDLTMVVRGLESIGHVPGRLERIECGQPFGVFVDYARNARALAGALRTLRSLTRGRLICVLDSVADRTTEIRRALSAARPGDCVLIAGRGRPTRQMLPDDCEVAKEWLYDEREEVVSG